MGRIHLDLRKVADQTAAAEAQIAVDRAVQETAQNGADGRQVFWAAVLHAYFAGIRRGAVETVSELRQRGTLGNTTVDID